MKKQKRELIIGLIMLFALLDVARAESISLTVSCTIPAIPGVNAPLIEEEKPQTKRDNPVQATVISQEETQSQTPAMIQEDSQEEKEISANQKTLVIVKTIYSR